LNKDGLLIPGQENKVELTGKHLKINGEKQPTNIYQKYKRIFEEAIRDLPWRKIQNFSSIFWVGNQKGSLRCINQYPNILNYAIAYNAYREDNLFYPDPKGKLIFKNFLSVNNPDPKGKQLLSMKYKKLKNIS
jgi:hypothetical protein